MLDFLEANSAKVRTRGLTTALESAGGSITCRSTKGSDPQSSSQSGSINYSSIPAKCKIDPTQLTSVLTSCGRFDLLEETIASFLNYFEVEKLIVAEDSENTDAAEALATKFSAVEMRINEPKLGQMRSIDELYRTIATPYILHLEDDWLFDNSLDVERVLDFMEAHQDISVVCIAHRIFDPRYARGAHKVQYAGIEYMILDTNAHPAWFSYSFNPSIARLSLWRQFGPFSRFCTEENLSRFLKARGMRIALVVPAIGNHIGIDRHAPDPYQPPRAKTLLSRLKRSALKRWQRVQGTGLFLSAN